MKSFIVTATLALTLSAALAQSQTNPTGAQPNPTASPSAGNSGAGIAGAPGNKNGPAATSGTTGSSASSNPTVQQQDSSTVKGLPGGKSGPAVKPEDRH
jgi:hypothetical protein